MGACGFRTTAPGFRSDGIHSEPVDGSSGKAIEQAAQRKATDRRVQRWDGTPTAMAALTFDFVERCQLSIYVNYASLRAHFQGLRRVETD